MQFLVRSLPSFLPECQIIVRYSTWISFPGDICRLIADRLLGKWMVMRAKLTKRIVDAVNGGAKDTFLWDTEVKGFGLKVTPAASESMSFRHAYGVACAVSR